MKNLRGSNPAVISGAFGFNNVLKSLETREDRLRLP